MTKPVVLVVEDETDVAKLYRRMIEPAYTVRVVTNGEDALDALDGVDVVLLDRMLPGMQGEEVLAVIRERDVDCRVAMVTAVEPDIDIVEMGFDAYIQKPPTKGQLRETIADLLDREAYTAELQEYCAALAKRTALDERESGDVSDTDEYAALEAQISALEATLDDAEDELANDMAFLSVLRSIEDEHERQEEV